MRRPRAVIRLPGWLGDALMAEPVLRAACAELDACLIGPAHVLELFEGRFPAAERAPLASRDLEHPAHYGRADLALLLNGSLRSALCALRAGVPLRAGFARGARRACLTHALGPALERGGRAPGIGRSGRYPRALPRPFVAACIEVAGAAGIRVEDRRPRLEPRAADCERVRARLERQGVRAPFWLVHAGARPSSAKGYPPELWARLLAELARLDGGPIVVACAPGEEQSARAAVQGLRAAVLLDDPAPGVGELIALSALARAVITPDNGARHVAQALDRPTLVLCGPTDPRHTAEHGPRTRVLRVEVPCGPCHRERCPLPGSDRHACMRSIEPERAARAALELVQAETLYS